MIDKRVSYTIRIVTGLVITQIDFQGNYIVKYRNVIFLDIIIRF